MNKGLASFLFFFIFFITDKQQLVAGVVPAIEKARLYRGKGGEIMRSAVSRFIECISISHLSLTGKTKRSLLDTLNENLRHPNSQIQVVVFWYDYFARQLMLFLCNTLNFCSPL
jgi:hypothetical protein